MLAWVGGSLPGLALAACAAGAYWLYGWKRGSLEFHEGWAPQERQVLAGSTMDPRVPELLTTHGAEWIFQKMLDTRIPAP